MNDSTVSDCNELGRLWLPWYVSRDGARVIEDLARAPEDARAPRIADTVDRDHVVLRHPHPDPAYPGWTHDARIEHYVAEMSGHKMIGLKAPAWEVEAGILLRDGCHRACAIYRVDPPAWAMRLVITPAPAHARDALPSLRSG